MVNALRKRHRVIGTRTEGGGFSFSDLTNSLKKGSPNRGKVGIGKGKKGNPANNDEGYNPPQQKAAFQALAFDNVISIE